MIGKAFLSAAIVKRIAAQMKNHFLLSLWNRSPKQHYIRFDFYRTGS